MMSITPEVDSAACTLRCILAKKHVLKHASTLSPNHSSTESEGIGSNRMTSYDNHGTLHGQMALFFE